MAFNGGGGGGGGGAALARRSGAAAWGMAAERRRPQIQRGFGPRREADGNRVPSRHRSERSGSYLARSSAAWEEPFSARVGGALAGAAWAREFPGCMSRYCATRFTTRSRDTTPSTATPHLLIPAGSFMALGRGLHPAAVRVPHSLSPVQRLNSRTRMKSFAVSKACENFSKPGYDPCTLISSSNRSRGSLCSSVETIHHGRNLDPRSIRHLMDQVGSGGISLPARRRTIGREILQPLPCLGQGRFILLQDFDANLLISHRLPQFRRGGALPRRSYLPSGR